MATQDFKRKLSAILSADVKGYSRLMQEDEEATVRTITAYREVFGAIIEKHHGRVVDSPGDNILAEFSSVVDAVRSAVEVQEEFRVKNDELPEERRMEFRIGINLGDVIQEGDRIYGDGVNVAARVEGLAEAGGISVSGTVYDSIKNKLALGYESLGEHSVKNIAEPVRVFRVLMDPEAVGRVIGEERPKPAHRMSALAAVIVLLLVAGGLAIWKFIPRTPAPSVEVASVKKMAFPLPDKPSIAVLPFDNMSDDPKQEYFSDGITEDLITDLSKISGLFVIARNSTFTYKGKPVKVQQVAEDLGVRYVLEGSVRKAGEQVRINAQLVDATTGHHLWAERLDGQLGDIFALQDRFTRKIVAALAVKLSTGEQEQLANKGTANVEAYEAMLQGWEHQRRNTRDDLVKAVEYYKRAIELDPDFSRAHAFLASAYHHVVSRRWEVDLGWTDARSLGKKHLQIAMENPTPLALRTSARYRVLRRQYEEAIAETERALALDPNDVDSHFRMGYVLLFAGRSAEAIDSFKTAMRLNPHYPGWYIQFLGIAQYCLERYADAATSQERAFKIDPSTSAWWRAATYAQLGREQEAADALTKYIESRGWHLVYVYGTFQYWPFKDPRDLDRFAEGLVKAGLPRPENPAYRRKYSEAVAQAENAIALNPSDAKAHRMMAEALIFDGRSTEALGYINKAISLEPDNTWYLYTLGLAQFCLGQYGEAATTLEKFSSEHKFHSPRWLLAATYAHLGRQKEAEQEITYYRKYHWCKDYTVERVLKIYLHAFKDPKDTERFAQGLHMAGLPMK
jgi:TolB-like protein/class 3 adenylate cyclase/Flp pilus assembly protein TadD